MNKIGHLLNIESLSVDVLKAILERSQVYIEQPNTTCLENKVVVNLFFENSTRTRVSFELAALQLGAKVINISASASSIQKGETLLDTLKTLQAMQVDYIVIRSSHEHSLEQLIPHFVNGPRLINAGDGIHAHPTQAILDLLTILQVKGEISPLKIAIVGDSKHSRVARSLVQALQKFAVSDIRLVGPDELLLDSKLPKINNLQAGLKNVDVIVTLRVQKERLVASEFPDKDAYFANYGITEQALSYAKTDAMVMHPGPINRGIEIAASVADGSQSYILQQVKNGIAVRKAVLSML